MLPTMELHTIKRIVAVSWVAFTLLLALVIHPTGPLQIAFVALGALPPLALLLLWNHPVQTMTEALDEARRRR